MNKHSLFVSMLTILTMLMVSSMAFGEDEKPEERLSPLIDAFGKKVILAQIIETDETDFTIRIENEFKKSEHPLRGINAAFIDPVTIRYDMKRYGVTLDELNKRLIQYNEEQAALKQERTEEQLERQERARARALRERKRLMEEAVLQSTFEETIGKPIEAEEVPSDEDMPDGAETSANDVSGETDEEGNPGEAFPEE